MFKRMRAVFICLVLLTVKHAMTVTDQEADSISHNTSKDHPELIQTGSKSTSKSTQDDGNSNTPADVSNDGLDIAARRFIVRFPHRTKPVPFDEVEAINQNQDDDIDRKILIRRLENLKTYIIEMGKGNGLDDVQHLKEFLMSEGATVEMDTLATLSGSDDDLTNDTTTSMKEIPNNDPLQISNKLLHSKEQWYMELLEIDRAWHQMKKLNKKLVKVCIVDTGLNYQHAALSSIIDINQVELDGTTGVDDDENGVIDDIYGANFVENNGDPMDTDGHGTNVAGIIAAKLTQPGDIAGINPQARLVTCKAFDAKQGYITSILQCIDYCMTREAFVQNHSWTLDTESDALKSAFAMAEDRNILMVVSAGNANGEQSKRRNIDKNIVVPAIYSKHFLNVLTVSGMQITSQQDMMERIERCKMTKPASACQPSKEAQYVLYYNSKYGPILSHIAAPAYSIHTLGLRSGTVVVEGVSMATAIMTGVASLLLSIDMKYLNLTAANILYFMRDSVMPTSLLKSKVRWGGYVNCRAAVISIWRYNRALRLRKKELKTRITHFKKSDKLVVIV